MRKFFLETERLGFSHWEEGDLPLARQLWGEAEVTRYICASGVFSPGEIEARLRTEIDNTKNMVSNIFRYLKKLRKNWSAAVVCGRAIRKMLWNWESI